METLKTERSFLMAFLIIVLLLTIAIFYPFLAILIISVSFAVVLNPLYKLIKKYITMNRAGWASLITIVIFLIVLGIPIFFVGTVIFDQAQSTYHFMVTSGNTNEFIQKIDASINRLMPNGFTFDTYGKVSNLISFLSNNIGKFFTTTLNTILMFILTIFTMFFMLKNGGEWKEGLIKLIPLSEKNVKEILLGLKNSINRVLRGSFIIAIVQGILSWVGLWIFGVPNPALWGVVAGMSSFVPTIGTSIVSVPAVLFLFFTGMPLHALGLLIWSLVIVGLVDNILSPYIISKNSEVPPIFILFSILGGLSLMGPIGILVGPLTISLLYSLVSIYRK